MKIEKIKEIQVEKQDIKEYSIKVSEAPEMDINRLAAMINFLAYPSSTTSVSIVSLRNSLKSLKIQQGPAYQSSLQHLFNGLKIRDIGIRDKIQRGLTFEPLRDKVTECLDENKIIDYLFSSLKYPETDILIQKFMNSHDIDQRFSEIIETSPDAIVKYANLLYIFSPEKLVVTFQRYISINVAKKSIKYIVNFIITHENLLKVMPDGKLMHLIYSKLAESISGPAGAHLLAAYSHSHAKKSRIPNKIAELYLLCDQKDAFEKLYSEYCVERLLRGSDIRFEFEMCEKIRALASPDSMHYVMLILNNTQEHKIDCENMSILITKEKLLNTINPFIRIAGEYIPKQLPEVLNQFITDYTKKFRAVYSKKVLKFEYLNSIVEISYGKAEILCNFVQALILLMFNSKVIVNENEIMEYIVTHNLSEGVVKNQLESMRSLVVCEGSKYKIIDGSFGKMDFIKQKESEFSDMQETLEGMRKHIVDALVVKILKNAKQIEEHELIERLKKNLRFSLDFSLFSDRLLNLEKRGFIWKADSTYGYIP